MKMDNDINTIIAMAEGNTTASAQSETFLVPRDKVGTKIEARALRKNMANNKARGESKPAVTSKQVAKVTKVALPKRPSKVTNEDDDEISDEEVSDEEIDDEEDDEPSDENTEIKNIGKKRSKQLTPSDLMPTKKHKVYHTDYVLSYDDGNNVNGMTNQMYLMDEDMLEDNDTPKSDKKKRKKWYNSRIFHISVIVVIIILIIMTFYIMYCLMKRKLMSLHQDVMRYPTPAPVMSTTSTVNNINPTDGITEPLFGGKNNTNDEPVIKGGKLRDSRGRFISMKKK